jgi:hypothetical protein
MNVDKNGECAFSLVFPPIPAKTERFDLCFQGKNWIIWDIELKKPKKNNTPSTVHVPDEFIQAAIIQADGKDLEAPQWNAADAMLKGYFAGYKPEMRFGVLVAVNNNITGDQETYTTDVNPNGTFELAVPMTVTQQVLFRVLYSSNNNEIIRFNDYIVVSPNEETKICIDLPAYFRERSRLRYDKQNTPKLFYFAGANAEINNQYFDVYKNNYHHKIYDASYYNNAIVKMTAQEYKEYVMNIKNQCMADINENSSITLKMKNFFKTDLEYEAAFCLYYIKSHISAANNRIQGSANRNMATDSNPLKLDKDYFSYLKDLPLNDPISLYFNHYNK